MGKRNLLFGLVLFGLTACRHQPSDRQKTIAVTLEPLRYFTEAIAGDRYRVTSMVPEGAGPETYDPTPQQLIDLSRSEAYFRIGYIGFELNWMDKLKANAPHLSVFDTSEGIELIANETSHHARHHGPYIEPHVWNSARNAVIIADNICRALCTIDAANKTYYTHRLDSLQRTIQYTDSVIRVYLQQADSVFLIFHPVLSYFARDYGLTQIAIEHEGKEPSSTYLQALVKEGKERRARVVFIQKEFDTRNAQLIADEMGLSVVQINPLSYRWPEEMIHIAQSLAHIPQTRWTVDPSSK